MKFLKFLPAILVFFLAVGCSSTTQTTTSTTRDSSTNTSTATRSTSSASADTTTDAAAEPEKAPQDWYHLARDTEHVPGLATQKAYRTLLNDRSPRDTVTVAIIDSGIDVDHEDLSSVTWTNHDEIAGNGKDDDGNGYVDDRKGWNFIGGPNGDNVNHDTYELTRLYVDYKERFAEMDSASVPADERDAYERYRTIREKFEQKRQQAKQQLQKVRKARDAVKFAEKVVRTHLETDSLTKERVETLSAANQNVRKAREILLYFYRQDLSPADIEEYYEHQKNKVEYNYDPEFNPRSVVGDDYSDKRERIYGNENVTGPDAHHGTHVGGIIGAHRENGIGIDGIASGVRLMSIRAVPNGDERDKDVANAIRYAVDNGADVINMSFGKAYSPHKDVVDSAVRYADSLGVLMIHAAGNDGDDVDSTSNYPTQHYENGGQAQLWIEVGASSWTPESDLVAPFSNYGDETVHVFAPGQSIYSTVPGNAYERNDGTSMAAPMVAGVSALIMAYYPELTAGEVRSIILETATPYKDVMVSRPGSSEEVPFGSLSRTGAIVNAYDALKRADKMSAK